MTTDTTAINPTTPAPVDTDVLVGNPRRTRGLDASVVHPRSETSDLVGNPRRTRGLHAAVVDAA
jgi:hypothetical protein